MSMTNAERQKKWRDKHKSYYTELVEVKKKCEEARLMLKILKDEDEETYYKLKREVERWRKT